MSEETVSRYLSEEHLEKLTGLLKKRAEKETEVFQFDYQARQATKSKESAYREIDDLNTLLESLFSIIQEEHGQVNVNLETGELTEATAE